ncbi:hypothetical protein [Embleya sp. NBC_00896]|uniref:hypothetical protein n=1 Tax=Embleya sp. NBC_00896 TaxID=2975961 RepID=UPI002F90D723|nr:hypothetical protein OG928_33050 [Embleya sp. NBC_00896]
MSELTPSVALAQAERLKESVDRQSRWVIRFQLAYGTMAFAQVLTLALLGGRLGAIVSTAVWVPLIVGLSVYAARQPVAHRGMAVTHYVMMGTWATLYGLVLGIGVAFFPGDPAWWLAGAVLVALPGFVAACVTSRRVRA